MFNVSKLFITVLCALCATLAIAACGGDDGGGEGDSPLDSALRYLPADTPFVAAVETDVDGSQVKAAEQILEKFPFGDQIKSQIKNQVTKEAGDSDELVALLGNEFAIGSTDAKAFVSDADDENFVGAIQSKDGDKLAEFVKKDAKELGEASGATLYETEDGTVGAVEGDMLIVAGDRAGVEAALERRDGDDTYTEDALDEATEGIAEESIVRAAFDAEKLLAADSGTADARKAKFISALRTVGLGLTVEGDEIRVEAKAATEGLEGSDQPIATGGESPEVLVRKGELGFGVRDVGQIVTFGEAVAQAVDPNAFGQYQQGRSTIEKQLEISIDDDLLAQIGDVSGSVDPASGRFGVVAEVEDGAKFERTLEKLRPALAQARDDVVFSLEGEKFVAASDAATARAVRAAPTRAVEGASGAVVTQASIEELAAPLLSQFGPSGIGQLFGGQFLAPLGNLIGSMEASDDGLSASFRITFD